MTFSYFMHASGVTQTLSTPTYIAAKRFTESTECRHTFRRSSPLSEHSVVPDTAGAQDGEDHEEDVDDVQEDGERAADVLVRRHLHALPRHHQLEVIDQVHLHAQNK